MTLIAPANPTFLANMRQLWRRDARLAQRIDELPLDAGLAILPAKSGLPTAQVRTAGGREIFLHSRYDPAREAEEFCENAQIKDAACVVLCGLGLGYHARAILSKTGDDACLLIGEPDLLAIRAALEQFDFSTDIAAGRIEFLPQHDTPYLHERLRRCWALLMMGTRIVAPPVFHQLNADFHEAFRRAIADYAAFARMSLMTLLRNAGVTCRNIANNLPTYVSTPSIGVLRGRYRGYPAILVAAGPSLAKNVDQLRALQDRAVIIAAQTTLKPLLERGIRPHFVTSLDYSELSRQFFEGVEIPDETVLVAEPKASWHVIDRFRAGETNGRLRRVALLDAVFAHRCVGEALGRRPGLEAGATVMHLAFYLAEWLGCDPIVFTGQDLAFTDHCYYAPGVAIHRAWSAELGRYSTLEMKEWERIARQRNILRKVVDVHGRSIFTDEQMFTYLQQFERDFARTAARVIDATEGGARKTGAACMTLKDVAEQLCTRTIDPACFEYLDVNWADHSRMEAAREVMASRLADLAALRSICSETRERLVQLKMLLNSPAEFNRMLVRVDELRTMVQRYETIYQMVRDVSQLAEFQRMQADRRVAATSADDKERATRQLDRDLRFMDAMLDGCDRLERILSESMSRFDLLVAGHGDATPTRPDGAHA